MESNVVGKVWRRRDGLDVFKHKNRSSHIWRGLVHGSEALKHTCWRLGNGKRINFWREVWVGEEPLIMIAQSPITEMLLHMKVCEFWEAERGWKWEMFDQFLPTGILMKIALTVVSGEEETEDILEWGGDGDGCFTAKRAYEESLRHQPTNKLARMESNLEA